MYHVGLLVTSYFSMANGVN